MKKLLLGISFLFLVTGCATVNDGLEETDQQFQKIESKGTDIVNVIFQDDSGSE